MTFIINGYKISPKERRFKLTKIIKSIQEWLPFDKILEDGIIVDKQKYIKILKIKPINYELKSDLEKEAILDSYKLFLKTCNFNIQILIQSRKEKFNSFISLINSHLKNEKNSKIEKISNSYIEYLQNMNQIQNSSSKNFYILIFSQIDNKNEFNISQIRESLNDKVIKIKDCLSRCGNAIFEANTRKETEKIMYSFYNFRKILRFI